MTPGHDEQFISEPILPQAGTADTQAMGRGEPGLPTAFTWRSELYTVAGVLSTWKTSSLDAGRLYLRRHWFRILTTSGQEMVLYCERQARNREKPKARWWLYTVQ